MFILIRLTQHVSGIIMPIIRRTGCVNNCMCSVHCVKAHSSCPNFARLQPTQPGILHMQLFTQPVLLMMGIMMPETCWVNLMRINIYTMASSWFFLIPNQYCHFQDNCCVYRRTIIVLYWYNTTGWLLLNWFGDNWSPIPYHTNVPTHYAEIFYYSFRFSLRGET